MRHTNLLLIVFTGALTACGGPVGFNSLSGAGSSSSVPGGAYVLPACAVSKPQLVISGNVNSFQLTSNNGFSFGYGVNPTTSITIGTKIATMTMDLALNGSDPVSRRLLAPTDVTSTQSNTSTNLGIDYKGIQLGTTGYSSTPIGATSQSAIDSALGQMLSTANKNLALAWLARIQSILPGGLVQINAGTAAGVAVNDKFTVTNMVHTDPCQADDVVYANPSTPVATITVTSVSNDYSLATVVLSGTTNLAIGSEIQPVTGNNKTYKRRVSLGTITAKPLQLSDGTQLDIQPSINAQLAATAGNYFYVIP